MNAQVNETSLVAEEGTVALLNRSEIEQQITTARRFPRSVKRFRDEAMQMVTLDVSIAEGCVYALPRDGKTIEGPSARFAEVIASAWGNCRAGARVIDDHGEFVTAQGVFHDLERNVAITYEVQRRITDKQGRRYKADMIGVTANAACSIALRNAILKGVPKAFWSDMYTAARQVIMGDVKTLVNRRADAIAAFVRFGINAEQICAKLGVVGIEDIGMEHLVVLRGLLTALRDGDTTPEDAFANDANGPSVVSMPKAKPKGQPTAGDGSDPIKTVITEGEPAQADKPETKSTQNDGQISELSLSQQKLLSAKLKAAGLSQEQIATGFGDISPSSINEALAWIKANAAV